MSQQVRAALAAPMPEPGEGRRRERRALLSLMRYAQQQVEREMRGQAQVGRLVTTYEPDLLRASEWQAMADEIAAHVLTPTG